MSDWVEGPYQTYKCGPDYGDAVFIRRCSKCNRFVRADKEIWIGEETIRPGPNATCKKCGRTEMDFQGFF